MPARLHRSVTCLGVGDGIGSLERGHAAFLYRFGGTRFLLDCGEPATRAVLGSGTRLDDLDHIFISHLHFDHVGGLFTLLQTLWLSRRKRPLTIHVPEVGIAPIRALLRTALIFDAWQAFPLRFEPIQARQPVLAGTTTVTPVPSSHLRKLGGRPGEPLGGLAEAFSFILDDGRCRVAHSADIGGVEDVPTLIQQPLDLFVCELAHVKPAELLATLRGRPIRHLALVHLTADQWRCRRGWLARASRDLAPIRVHLPEDGARLRF